MSSDLRKLIGAELEMACLVAEVIEELEVWGSAQWSAEDRRYVRELVRMQASFAAFPVQAWARDAVR